MKLRGCSRTIFILLIFVILSIIYFERNQSIIETKTLSFRQETFNSTELDSSPFVELPSRNYDLIIWSSDFHISPVADIKFLLSKYGVKFIDKSLSGHCHLSNTCERDLRVINKLNGIELGNCPNQLRREFYESYRNDKEFMSADIILCTHSASMCELFMPFNKTLIVISSTRYEIGRYDKVTWTQWNNNLQRISEKNTNFIASNNKYDLVSILFTLMI